jgi:hypothetical protein
MAAGLLAVSLPILATTTIGARGAPVPGAAQDSTIDTPTTPTDFSSRGGGGGGRGGGGGGGRGGGMGGGGRGGGMGGGGRMGGGGGRTGVSHAHSSGRTGGRTGSRTGSSRTGGSRTGSSRTGGTRTGNAGTRTGGSRTGGTRTGGTKTGGTRTGTTGTRTGGTRTGNAGTRVGGTRVGGTRVGGARVGNVTSIRGRRWTTFTGRRIWWNGGWRNLIGISLLTGWAIGDVFYYPEGYVAYSQPLCTGYTDDGCVLRWQDVATDDGSTIPQCVQACPKVRKPVEVTTPAPVAAAPRKGCEVVVFADKNLQGQSFKTTDDQPLLNDQWDKQISSIQVVAGTWDFSTEAQYGGDAMRLAPGSYRDLGATWDDQISSFQCIQ